MKKFLIILIIILSTSMILASQEMQMELLAHWKTNGIRYFESDESISLPITEDWAISVYIMKEYDSIFFMFSKYIEDVSFTENFVDFMETEKLPYSKQFRKDLFDCFLKNWNYYKTFGRTAGPHYEWIGDYLVNVEFLIDIDYFPDADADIDEGWVFLEID